VPPALVIEEPLPPQPAVPPMSRRATQQKSEVDTAPQGRAAVPESSANSIVLGTHPYIFEQFRQELAAFEEEFSDRQLSLDFDCYVVDQVAIAFSEARINLALFYARGETRTLPSDYLWSERWSLFVGAGHRLAHHGSVTRDDLAGEGLLLSAASNRLRPITMACLEAGGLGDLPVAAESDDHLFLAEDCRKGGGVLPLFGPAARRMGAMAGLRRLPYAHHIPPVEVRRAIHPRALGNMGAMALADLLKRSLA
jgi:DNA-binding transcriptional LysR family regulator